MALTESQRVRLDADVHKAAWLTTSERGQALLRDAYQRGVRPRCQCAPTAPELYISQRGQRFYLGRMPGTGFLHDPGCADASTLEFHTGAATYRPHVLVEHEDHWAVRLDAALPPQLPAGSAVRAEGLLDLLLELANLNRAEQGPAGHRTWTRMAELLRSAIAAVQVESAPLAEHLHLVEPFDKSHPEALGEALLAFLQRVQSGFILCELRDITPGPFDWRIGIKGIARCPVWMPKQVRSSVEERAGALLPEGSSQAVALLQVSAAPSGCKVRNLAIRYFYGALVPCANPTEAAIARSLLASGRTVIRPLRFDAPDETALPDFLVTAEDAAITPVFVSAPTEHFVRDHAKRLLLERLLRHGYPLMPF